MNCRLMVAPEAQTRNVSNPHGVRKGPTDVRFGSKADICSAKGMSALPPKADMCGAQTHVRFVPKADMAFADCRHASSEIKSCGW